MTGRATKGQQPGTSIRSQSQSQEENEQAQGKASQALGGHDRSHTEPSLSATMDRLYQILREITQMKAKQEKVEDKVDSLEIQIPDLEKLLDFVHADLDTVKTEMKAMEGRVNNEIKSLKDYVDNLSRLRRNCNILHNVPENHTTNPTDCTEFMETL